MITQDTQLENELLNNLAPNLNPKHEEFLSLFLAEKQKPYMLATLRQRYLYRFRENSFIKNRLNQSIPFLQFSEYNCEDFFSRNEISRLIYFYVNSCLLYTSPSPRDATLSRMPSSA